ncbi:hypothetical protein ACWGJW_09355, partial [Streptomyces nigrescens]
RARELATVLATGDSVDTLAVALASAPYGQRDIGLVFRGLDFTNPVIEDHYWCTDRRIMTACFALAHPQERPLSANSTGTPSGPYTRCRLSSPLASSTATTAPARPSKLYFTATSART